MNLEYFKRVWILQEIALAERLLLIRANKSIEYRYLQSLFYLGWRMTDSKNISKRLQFGGQLGLMELGIAFYLHN